jgi:hypothetical protein
MRFYHGLSQELLFNKISLDLNSPLIKIMFKNCCYKYLLLISILILPLVAFAEAQYTKIDKVKMYSEYYPNSQAKYRGTIVFENGGINTTAEWTENKKFFNCVRQYGGLFLYDRSGMGKSDPDFSSSLKNPITAKTINDKLLTLLKTRHIPSPYILVAHSRGGLFAGYFAKKHPNLVSAVLMVDPSPANFEVPAEQINAINTMKENVRGLFSKEIYAKYSYNKTIKSKNIPAALFYDMLGIEQTKKQIQQLPALSKEIPIIVLSSSFMEKLRPLKKVDWYQSQQQWLNDNPNSEIIRIESGHFIQQDHPRFVCEQIRKLVDLATSEK